MLEHCVAISLGVSKVILTLYPKENAYTQIGGHCLPIMKEWEGVLHQSYWLMSLPTVKDDSSNLSPLKATSSDFVLPLFIIKKKLNSIHNFAFSLYVNLYFKTSFI